MHDRVRNENLKNTKKKLKNKNYIKKQIRKKESVRNLTILTRQIDREIERVKKEEGEEKRRGGKIEQEMKNGRKELTVENRIQIENRDQKIKRKAKRKKSEKRDKHILR